ncbi:MAG: four helix bundle protein [Chitinophagales bacterium]|nr:four helix bundle protein [Bacteroidota bacterium]MBP8916943.1 four helix bundle protein [Chitinophagales bacterium]MBP9220092.1 four helix bundle protein [Chitinophagales bacterium]MBP9795591.1 four helix bundle protein [Chitinophagales bacterium]
MNNPKKDVKYDLEDRLIEFSVLIFKIVDSLFNTRAGNHIAGQLVRSGSNPALHYGEAQSAESRKDFIHKIKILLKELRESRAALKLIYKTPLTNSLEMVENGLSETNQLISIFMASVKTAKKNMEKEEMNN